MDSDGSFGRIVRKGCLMRYCGLDGERKWSERCLDCRTCSFFFVGGGWRNGGWMDIEQEACFLLYHFSVVCCNCNWSFHPRIGSAPDISPSWTQP